MNPHFYFEQLFQTALGGIDVNVTGPVIQLAGVILLLSMLFGVYEAYSNGGEVRQLALVEMKYLVLGLVFLNYQQAFRAVNAMFNSVADYMYNLNGIGDVYQSWSNALATQWNANWSSSLWNIVTGGLASAILSALLTLIGYILLPITYTLFTLAYTMYGSVLYVVGPFVLALMPSRSLGRLARTYFVNLVIFQAWGLLYAILQVLMTALQMGSLQQALGSNSIFNAFVGTNPVTLMGLASLLFSISIALIPLIASRIVHGDVGSTLMDVGRAITFAAGTAATLAFTGGGALAAGRATSGEGAPPPPPQGGGSKDDGGGRKDGGGGGTRTASHSGSGSGGLALAEAKPPSPPVSSEAEIAGVPSSATSGGTAGAEESAASGAPENGSPSLLWNPKTGQVFSWNGSGWEGAGHVSNPADSSLIQANGGSYGVTNWRGESAGQSRSGYHGHSLFGFAVWQAGTLAGRTMRAVGMGKEA